MLAERLWPSTENTKHGQRDKKMYKGPKTTPTDCGGNQQQLPALRPAPGAGVSLS